MRQRERGMHTSKQPMTRVYIEMEKQRDRHRQSERERLKDRARDR